MLLILRGALALPVLLTTTDWVWPGVLTACVPNDKEGVSVMLTTPVPLSATVCGLPLALSVNVKLALRCPTSAGLNVTFTTVLLPGATESGAAGENEKSFALLTAMVM